MGRFQNFYKHIENRCIVCDLYHEERRIVNTKVINTSITKSKKNKALPHTKLNVSVNFINKSPVRKKAIINPLREFSIKKLHKKNKARKKTNKNKA